MKIRPEYNKNIEKKGTWSQKHVSLLCRSNVLCMCVCVCVCVVMYEKLRCFEFKCLTQLSLKANYPNVPQCLGVQDLGITDLGITAGITEGNRKLV